MIPSYFHTTAVEVEDKGNSMYDQNLTCLCSVPVFYCANSRGKEKKKSLAVHPISFPVELLSSEVK